MPIIRKQLKPSDVYPDDIRYDETTEKVQRFIDGEWEDAPESDPRTQTTLPPRVTGNTACDAARSIVDALDNEIDQILTAIDNGATAFTIAGLILGLLSFGVFAIFISIALFIADAMLTAGSTALDAALTGTVWDELECILYCNMNSSGRIISGSLATIQGEVDAQIGGLAATIINSMLALAGEGGLNNLAALGTSTGDCDLCGCAECECNLFNWNWGSVFGSPVTQGFTRNTEACGIFATRYLSGGNYYWGIDSASACTVGIVIESGTINAIMRYIPAAYAGSWSYSNESVGWVNIPYPATVNAKAILLRSTVTFAAHAYFT